MVVTQIWLLLASICITESNSKLFSPSYKSETKIGHQYVSKYVLMLCSFLFLADCCDRKFLYLHGQANCYTVPMVQLSGCWKNKKEMYRTSSSDTLDGPGVLS